MLPYISEMTISKEIIALSHQYPGVIRASSTELQRRNALDREGIDITQLYAPIRLRDDGVHQTEVYL